MFTKPEEIKLKNYELILTENCNLRCKYCFDDAFSDRTSCSYDYRMKPEMIDDILNFVDKTRDKSIKPKLSFFGGEPTLNWEFIEAFLNKAGNYFDYSINTNMLLLDSRKIDIMIKYKVFPILSIDGVKEAHDSNRIDKIGNGSWVDTMKILPELASKYRSSGIRPTVLMVVDNNNLNYLEKSYEFLIKLGFGVNILYNFNTEYTNEEMRIIENQLDSLFNKRKFPIYGDAKKRILNTSFHEQENFCHTPYTTATIASNGKLFFCHQLVPKMSDFTENYNEYYGDIYKGYYNKEYLEIISNRTKISKFKLNKECENCPAVRWCKGGCLASMRIETGNYEELVPSLCKINRMLDSVLNKKRK